jgi:hypothetical protein
MKKLMREWKRVLLALVMAAITTTWLTGCVVHDDVHDDRWHHDHDHDHDHDEHPDHP